MKFLQSLLLKAIQTTTARINGLLAIVDQAQEQILTIRDIIDHLEQDVRNDRLFFNDIMTLITFWKQPTASFSEIQFRVKLITLSAKHLKVGNLPEIEALNRRMSVLQFAMNVNSVRLVQIRNEFAFSN